MSILNTLATENYFIVNRNLVKNLGLEEAVLVGELASEYNYYSSRGMLDNNGWFFSTLENVEEKTTLSKYNQNKIIKKLKELNILETKLKGVPARRYIRINEEELEKFLKLDSKNLNNPDSKIFNQLDGKKISQLYKNNIIKNNNKNNNINKESNKERMTSFKKPSIDEINDYCKERHNGIDGSAFYDFYESKGWFIGKTKMKDWKAAIRTWERRHKQDTMDKTDKIIEDWLNGE